MLRSLSHVQLSVSPWTVVRRAALSMGFPRQEQWSGLPFPALGDLPDPGIAPASLASPALAGGFLTSSTTVKYGLPGSDSGKEPTCQCRRRKRQELDPQSFPSPFPIPSPAAAPSPAPSHSPPSLCEPGGSWNLTKVALYSVLRAAYFTEPKVKVHPCGDVCQNPPF